MALRILQKVKTWLQPPQLPDQRAQPIVSMMHNFFLVFLGASLVLLVVTFLRKLPMSFFGLLVIDIVILLNLWLVRRGKTRVPSILIPSVILIVINYILIVERQRIHDITILGYPMLIALTGLFIGRRAALGFTALSIVSLIGIFIAETNGWIAEPEFAPILISDLVITSILLSLTGALVYFAMQVIENSMRILATRQAQLKTLNQELEMRIEQRTNQLKQANQELESFSYSISHDLRAPLRAIASYSQLLAEENEAQLDENGQHYLQRVHQNAVHMQMLIDSLLKFSRLGSQALQLQENSEADLREMISDLVMELRNQNNDRQVSVEILPMQSCTADPHLLRQVWANLISNAFKFTRNRDHARIEIGQMPTQAGRAYYIRDNGAGFDMQEASKLFGVFERLHPADHYEGIGVGLATAQRIIQKHGGRIWAESEPEAGAIFYFTLASA